MPADRDQFDGRFTRWWTDAVAGGFLAISFGKKPRTEERDKCECKTRSWRRMNSWLRIGVRCSREVCPSRSNAGSRENGKGDTESAADS